MNEIWNDKIKSQKSRSDPNGTNLSFICLIFGCFSFFDALGGGIEDLQRKLSHLLDCFFKFSVVGDGLAEASNLGFGEGDGMGFGLEFVSP